MSISNTIHTDLIGMVRTHDWSYMMSDSHSVWEVGMRHEAGIKAKIHALCTIHREDAEAVLAECLSIRSEQYIDGLTHKVIRGWFKPYIA